MNSNYGTPLTNWNSLVQGSTIPTTLIIEKFPKTPTTFEPIKGIDLHPKINKSERSQMKCERLEVLSTSLDENG